MVRRTLDTVRDRADARDYLYTPRPMHIPPTLMHFASLPVLDQGQEGACTGFGLATAFHYCLARNKIKKRISPWYIYIMARKCDEWPGENYDGSSCRGALRAAVQFGACELKYCKSMDAKINDSIIENARMISIGSYYRVQNNVHIMQSALVDFGVLYCSAAVHNGWDDPKDGLIEFSKNHKVDGAHAFAIVGYDQRGFWIQNSWGKDYGKLGFCNVSYDDWERNGQDVWIPALARC